MKKIEYMNELSTPGLTGNWKAYTQITINKLPRLSQALYELIKGTDTKTEMTAYYAYAYSWINYDILLCENSVDAEKLFHSTKIY